MKIVEENKGKNRRKKDAKKKRSKKEHPRILVRQ
jgi:hypothetical protein